jgi:hypothetical protein
MFEAWNKVLRLSLQFFVFRSHLKSRLSSSCFQVFQYIEALQALQLFVGCQQDGEQHQSKDQACALIRGQAFVIKTIAPASRYFTNK